MSNNGPTLESYLGKELSKTNWMIKSKAWDFFYWYFACYFGKSLKHRIILDIILSSTDFLKSSPNYRTSIVGLDTICWYTGYSYPSIQNAYNKIRSVVFECPFCDYTQTGIINSEFRKVAGSRRHEVSPYFELLAHLQDHWDQLHHGHYNEQTTGILCSFCETRKAFLSKYKQQPTEAQREARRKNIRSKNDF